MKEMFRDVIQTVVEVEMDEQLGRERCERSDAPEGTPRNYRNGYTKKTVKTQLGEVDIKVSRDRNGSFEPRIIGKYDRNADGWIGEHESSKFWLNVLNDLKSRGVFDVYLFCTDGLCGMMQAIQAVFPQSRAALRRAPGAQFHQICQL